MRIKQVVPTIVARYLNTNTRKRTLFLAGKSGIGKSDSIYQASELLSKHIDDWRGVVDLRLANMDPTDVRGVPFVEGGVTHWARPDFFPQEGAGILFLDEITSAPPAIQAVAYQLALTPQDFGVPAEWMVVTAGNLKSDRGVTFNIAAPLQNRMCSITVETVLDDFIEYGVASGVRPEVLSFLRDRPDLLHKFEPSNEIKAFPSPRAWCAVSDLLSLDVPNSMRAELIAGDIGSEAAMTFEAHLRLFEQLPRIDDILDGKTVTMPKDLNALYCLAMGLAIRVDRSNIDGAWITIGEMPNEVQTLIMKLAHQRDRTIANAAAFSKWAIANAAAFSI